MPTDLQKRTQYLALAEFCQRIISSLWDFVDGASELPGDVLQDALGALQAVKSGEPYRFGQKNAAALGSYEQVRTIEEVWRTSQQIDDVMRLTSKLLNATAGAPISHHATARRLIDLFLKLQTRALWNFEQPTPSAPPDVGELCQALRTV